MKHIGRIWGLGFGLSMLLLFSGCGDSTDPCEDVLCSTPPANYCDGDSAVVYANDGTCADGSCSYTSQTVICDEGCSDGACNGDPCAGIVCNTPPADYCDGDSLMQYPELGVCDGGDCSYTPESVNCPYGCADGECNPCPSDCAGLCGGADDGCGGSCTADCPAGQYCDNQLCAACTVPSACGESCEDCATNTDGHDCINQSPDYFCGCNANNDCGSGDVCNGYLCCTPDCEGKVCGSDGCGGTCAPGCGVDEACDETTWQQCVTVGEFVTLEAGTFEMGSPEDEAGRNSDELQHTVTLTRGFRMLSTEVTQGGFEALMSYNPSHHAACGTDCPVEMVNWYMAAAYCNALSLTVGSEVCYTCTGEGVDVICEPNAAYATPYDCPGYRLPTEAEWEYAARAGTVTATYNGDLDSAHLVCEDPNEVLDPIAWFCGNSGASPTSANTIHAVGTMDSNDWDLYDMLGNVWEWCHDGYGVYPTESETDPWGVVTTGDDRVSRGGAWVDNARSSRAAYRYNHPPGHRNYALGFRPVRSLP